MMILNSPQLPTANSQRQIDSQSFFSIEILFFVCCLVFCVFSLFFFLLVFFHYTHTHSHTIHTHYIHIGGLVFLLICIPSFWFQLRKADAWGSLSLDVYTYKGSLLFSASSILSGYTGRGCMEDGEMRKGRAWPAHQSRWVNHMHSSKGILWLTLCFVYVCMSLFFLVCTYHLSQIFFNIFKSTMIKRTSKLPYATIFMVDQPASTCIKTLYLQGKSKPFSEVLKDGAGR